MQVDARVAKPTKSSLLVILAYVRLVIETDRGAYEGGCAEWTREEFGTRSLMRGEGGGVDLLGGCVGGVCGSSRRSSSGVG